MEDPSKSAMAPSVKTMPLNVGVGVGGWGVGGPDGDAVRRWLQVEIGGCGRGTPCRLDTSDGTPPRRAWRNGGTDATTGMHGYLLRGEWYAVDVGAGAPLRPTGAPPAGLSTLPPLAAASP